MKEKTHSENVAELLRANLDASVDIDEERIRREAIEKVDEALMFHAARACGIKPPTPGATRATKALQKENGRRLMVREEFLTQEEIAQIIDHETGTKELLAALDPDTLEAIADEIVSEFKHTARAHSLRSIAKKQRAAIAKVTP